MMCPEYGHKCNSAESVEVVEETFDSFEVKHANGTGFQDGDTVVIIKDLPVKGSPKAIKAGMKVKNITLAILQRLVS